MRQMQVGLACLSLAVALAAGPLGCSDAGEAGTAAEDAEAAARPRSDVVEFFDEGDAPVAHGAAFPVAAGECVLTTSEQRRRSGRSDRTSVNYTRHSYDAKRRVLSEISVDNRGDPWSAPVNFHTLLDAAGWTLALALDLEPGNGAGQRSYFKRDAQHNRTAALDAYSDLPIDAQPDASVGSWLSYSNEYDADGLLVHHESANRRVTLSFEHDEQGRCASANEGVLIRRFEYDAEGRLAATHFDPVPGMDSIDIRHSYAITQSYDDQGRLIASEQDGTGAAPPDGSPDVLELTSHLNDGSVIREQLDFTGDTPATRTHRFFVHSPGCQDLAESLPSHSTQACHTD